MSYFLKYRRLGFSEMREYVEGEDISNVAINGVDIKAGSPKVGDLIARNPKNHEDQWLVAQKYAKENLELIGETIDMADPFSFNTDEILSMETILGRETIANKALRRGLDRQLQMLKTCPTSREHSLSITKLQESIMWLGMDLKRINDVSKKSGFKISENPYPNSYDPSNTVIDPTADGLKL